MFVLARSAKCRHGGLTSWGGHGAAPQTQARRTAENRAHLGRDGRLVQGRGGFAPRGRQGAPDEAARTVVARLHRIYVLRRQWTSVRVADDTDGAWTTLPPTPFGVNVRYAHLSGASQKVWPISARNWARSGIPKSARSAGRACSKNRSDFFRQAPLFKVGEDGWQEGMIKLPIPRKGWLRTCGLQNPRAAPKPRP